MKMTFQIFLSLMARNWRFQSRALCPNPKGSFSHEHQGGQGGFAGTFPGHSPALERVDEGDQIPGPWVG